MHLTNEAKLRILFRLVRAGAEVTPCVKELKILAETLVDVADEVRHGTIKYSVPQVEGGQAQESPEERGPDLSLSVLWRELQFTHISFSAQQFRSLLLASGAIQLDRYFIVPSTSGITVHLDSWQGLKGYRQFMGARLEVGSSASVLTTPATNMYDKDGNPTNSSELDYDSEAFFSLAQSRWQVRSRPVNSLGGANCPLIDVDRLKCNIIDFSMGPDMRSEFSICVVQEQNNVVIGPSTGN